MIDEPEQELATLLHAHADATEVPRPPLDVLAHEGERVAASRRRRARLLAAVAVAVAIVTVAAGVRLTRNAAPTPAAQTPTHRTVTTLAGLPQAAYASQVPLVEHGDLLQDDRVLATDVDQVSYASGTSLFTQPTPGGPEIASLAADGTKTFLGAIVGPVRTLEGLVLSPDGKRAVAAIVDNHRHSLTLTEWSLPGGSVAGSTSIPLSRAGAFSLDGVDDSGRVVVTTHEPRSGFSWAPTEPGPQLLNPVEVDLVSAGLGAMGPNGAIRPRACDGVTHSVAPDGTHVLCDVDGDPGIGIVSVPTGAVAPLPAVAQQMSRTVGFEDDSNLLIEVKQDRTRWLLRCSVTGRSCERVQQVAQGTTYPKVP